MATESARGVIESIWDGTTAWAKVARAALAPFELVYAGVVTLRGASYDAGLLASARPALPALSVGNLSVGGTGKTPVAAWMASELSTRGGTPAIVLRGYGADEPLVHRSLNPDVPVIVSADRLRGAERARALGCDVAVLDDAFQHRRARRVADLVLVSADRWSGHVRLLPAGPWREPLAALRRATLVAITRKAATMERADEVARSVARSIPGREVAILHLAADELRSLDHDGRKALSSVRGARVLAIAAVGDPTAFARQLELAGASVTLTAYPDHHAYSAADAARLAEQSVRHEWTVCTLKDAVKLTPLWRGAPSTLWYVSQRVVVEREESAVERMLAAVLAARSDPPFSTGGSVLPPDSRHGH